MFAFPSTTTMLLAILFQLLLICGYSSAKGPPESYRSLYPKYNHEIYYNTMVPEDTEVDVILRKNQPQKRFFVLESGYRPLSVTVTPCFMDGVLEWKISHSLYHQGSLDSSYRSSVWSNNLVLPPASSPSATYAGRSRRSYSTPAAPPGTYSLELRSNTEGAAKVLVTTRSTSDLPFHPPLPPDPNLEIVKVKRNRILVSWQPSLTTRPHQYCVSSNNRGNYNSLCSAESDLLMRRNGVSVTCVGRKTWHLFKGLKRGSTYYFDAFVLDAATNASSAYIGVSATLRGGGGGGGVAVPRLKDDALATFALDEANGHTVNIKYHPGKATSPILIFAQSCTGPGPVNLHIARGGPLKQDIMSTTVMDVKTLYLPPTNASSLSLSLRSTTHHKRKVRLWVSSRKHSAPFPEMPEDKSVRVFDSLTTCDSITIGWKISVDERVKYCIYRRLGGQSLTEPQNFCETRNQGIQVLCRRYHRFSKRRFNNVIMQRVKGLRPGTTYLFEVQVTKVKGEMLPYEQVWARTRATCSKHNR
ncbi:Protein NDNF like protein [Argiope bruennichi]|uniref:Protein NDNF n=1 Tax=Argiope bruennichi TaxID=94029 RepID=A0A8T0G4E8_ARGBR|nr:Protein NDNF like protein [Argiope bruennichi]